MKNSHRTDIPRWGKFALTGMTLMLASFAISLATGPREADRIIANGPLPQSTFTVGEGPSVRTIRLEVASEPEQIRRGLMARNSVTADGMAFRWNGSPAAFWMHGTRIPLDIVYVGTTGRITGIRRGKPFDDSVLQSDKPTSLVIEVPAGKAATLGMAIGTRIAGPGAKAP